METLQLASAIYSNSIDMDFSDYSENEDKEIYLLESAIAKLKNSKSDDMKTLYNALSVIFGG